MCKYSTDSRNLLMDFGVASCKNRFRCRTRRLLGCSYILQVCLSTPLISVVPVYLAYSIESLMIEQPEEEKKKKIVPNKYI